MNLGDTAKRCDMNIIIISYFIIIDGDHFILLVYPFYTTRSLNFTRNSF